LELRLSDYHVEWGARCLSLSNSGCFAQTDQELDLELDLEVTLLDEELDQEIVLEAQVRWLREGGRGPRGAGIAFLERRSERLELLHDLVERLAVADVTTAARFREASEALPMNTILYVARDAPEAPTLSNEERSFLACIDGVVSLNKIRAEMPPEEWQSLAHAPFSLLESGVLTTAKIRGVQGLHSSAAGGRRVSSPTFLNKSFSKKQTDGRNQQAQEHLGKARAALAQNNPRLARTHLMLGLQLAPGDPEISALFSSLEE